jgi:hypothetical protein
MPYLYTGIAVGDMQWFYASVTRGNEVCIDRLFDITEQRCPVNVAETTMDGGNADTAWSRYLSVRPEHSRTGVHASLRHMTTMDGGNADTAWSKYLSVRPTHTDVLVSREIGISRVT